MENLENILKAIWPLVRKKHLYPELPAPECAKGGNYVGLDIKGKKISISREFVTKMSQVIDSKEVFEGLLDHAISHYLHCPWDFSTHLKLYKETKKVLKEKQMAQKVTDYFMDIVADTYCISQKDTPIPKIYRHLNRGALDEVIHALYQKIWGIDLGVEGHEKVSRKLSRLPFLDRTLWLESIRRFARVLYSFLEKEENLENLTGPNPMGSHKLRQYTAQEIEKGLQEFASDVAGPSEFKEIVNDFEDEIAEATQPSGQGMGLGPGRSVEADILYYMKLAENYSLPIHKNPMEKSGSLYPHHHVPWEVGKPCHDIDPWTSFGKIMPGITQTWKRLEGEVYGQEEGIPDCIVIIDSSGSMTDPRKSLSYAVLGAACACDAYLRNDAQVAVYNFSDASAGGRKVLSFSLHRMEIYRALCHYFGGGTRLKVENIEALQTDQIPDIFLITDMQITDLRLLIDYFKDCKNRITAVHIGHNKDVENFRRDMALHKRVGIYSVEKKEDIPYIVLGKIREYFTH